MYYSDFLEAANDEISCDLKQKDTVDAIKKLDKKYEKYSIPFNSKWSDGKFYKKITIENYGSGSYGTQIRNAVTGARYNIGVGTAEQDLFFKVIDATGRNGRKESLMLYYDSPEQYEYHHFTTVSPETKALWLEKSLVAQKRLKLL